LGGRIPPVSFLAKYSFFIFEKQKERNRLKIRAICAIHELLKGGIFSS